MGALSDLIGARIFLEPEEHEWGAAVRQWDVSGHFTGLMWFRSARVPLLYQAHGVREAGGVALLDSYYDKILACYLGRPGMEWLLAPDDPYFRFAEGIAQTDWHVLPDADCVISFEVTREDWASMLACRNRDLDRDEAFLRSFDTQRYFIEAAERLAAERNIRVVSFRQSFGTVEDAAKRLLSRLREENVLP